MVAADLLERVAEGEGRVLGVGADEGIRRTSHHDGLADAVALAETVWELVRTRPADPGDGADPGS